MKYLTNIFLLATLMSLNISCGQIKKTETKKVTTSKTTNKDSVFFKEAPQKLKTIVEKIGKINEVQGKYVGLGGSESENYKNFEQLEKTATTGELVLLTDNKNPTVACYASWALADKSYLDLSVIFKKFITQDRQVKTSKGCIKSSDNISNELYHRYWNSIDDKKKSTDKILIQLDSIILYSHNPYWLLMTRAMENRVYKEPYKTRIVFLAFEHGDRDAIFYLCNWHKAEYAEKIKTALVKYLKRTNFKNTGTTDYYKTVEELFKFNDSEIRKVVIAKMKKDKHWEMDKERFKYLLEDNDIYDIDNE